MRRHRFWVAAALALATVVGASTATARTGGTGKVLKPRVGGTLIFGSEQEPPCMNPDLNDCNNTWQFYYAQLVLRSAFVVSPRFVYSGDLLTRARLQLNPQRLTFYINPKARWNDGVPVTANDFVFTMKTILNKAWDSKPTGGGITSRVGYDQIRSARIFNAGKAVTFTFGPNFADWKDLFTTVLPQHALKGTDFSKVFINDFNNPKNGKPISDGPFVFQKWNHGSDFSLTRNPRWWGPHRVYLDRIVARFLTDSNTEIQQVKGGEVDAIYPQPQLPLAALRQQPGLVVQSHLGPTYEHIDIQQGPRGNPLAKNLWVRQALMMSINRKAILDTLFSKLNPSLQPLGNVIYLNNQPTYVNHFGKFNFNPARARQLLESHGCRKGGDGIYSCGGQRLSFQFESTAGNQLREFAFEIIQQQLKANGIEVQNNFKPSNVAFGQDLTSSNYQLFMFGWSGSPDPSPSTSIWSCPNDGGGQNYMNYCNPKVDTLLKQGNRTLDEKRRASLYNHADALLAADLPTIPLYQKPTFLVYKAAVRGMTDNTTQEGPMWNAQDWWLAK
jgi:peptide/nickel transport system substrate-binding protein